MKVNATIFGPLLVALVVGVGSSVYTAQTALSWYAAKVEGIEKTIQKIEESLKRIERRLDEHLSKEGAHLDVKTKQDAEIAWRSAHAEQHVRIFTRLRDLETK